MFFACFHLSLSQLDLYELPHVTIDVLAVSTCSPEAMFGSLCMAPRIHCIIRPRALKLPLCASRLALLLIILVCGDIQLNPGPSSCKCSMCRGPVRDDQDAIFCEVCLIWNHRSCVNMSVNEYYHWSEIDDGWVCPTECKKETFPFYDASLFTDESSLQSSIVYFPISITGANQQQHLKLLSLNAKSLFQNLMSYTLIAFASLPTSS